MKIKLRLSVKRFAEKMELVLRDNDHKGGWGECTDWYLHSRMLQEMKEYDDSKNPKELIDIANFCMMLFEVKEGYKDERCE